MCVIAVSPKNARQPSESELFAMWNANPHGAGYMTVRNRKVIIHKGFMEWSDFIRSVRSESFTPADPVIYHFRIATQGGINAEMTHPFPISARSDAMRYLDCECNIAICHNGIIRLTTSAAVQDFSDTALFVMNYLSRFIKSPSDIKNPYVLKMIDELGQSKFALMNRYGDIETVGPFFEHDGVLLSNEFHLKPFRSYTLDCKK